MKATLKANDFLDDLIKNLLDYISYIYSSSQTIRIKSKDDMDPKLQVGLDLSAKWPLWLARWGKSENEVLTKEM